MTSYEDIKCSQREMSLNEVNQLSKLNVHQFYGIEIEEFPARIAEVALWLTDHHANVALSEMFGQFYQRLPLQSSPHIHVANALRLDWWQIIPPDECSYILGNPPFVGGKFKTKEQRADMDLVASDVGNSGVLDYVTGWYFKAAEYIMGSKIVVGFVSTNSITQGEQVGVLWHALLQRFGVNIHFGHRTFSWESEARGKAHVHVVIVGFAIFDATIKRIFDYEDKNVTVTSVKNISPYLVEGPDRAITNRTTPLSTVPEIKFGNQPIDGGHLLLLRNERDNLLDEEPYAKNFIRLYLGSKEFINGEQRWCLWLRDATPTDLRTMPKVMKRIEAVRQFRLTSKRLATRKLAATPTQFAFISHPEMEYLLIPSVSSERRQYIPIGFMPRDVIASNLCLIVPGATFYHFGVLTSQMHMAWVRQVCGRLKSDYRYSAKLVYNNFPWPEAVTKKRREAVEAATQGVLDARKQYPTSTLADLYDPLTMPGVLLKAHQKLDRAVERCYRSKKFSSDRERFEFLFALYEKITAPLAPSTQTKRKSRRRRIKATKRGKR